MSDQPQDGQPTDSEKATQAESEQTQQQELSEKTAEQHTGHGDALTESATEQMGSFSIDTEAAQPANVAPSKELPSTPPPPEPPAGTEKPYRDPTPKTPVPSRMPSTKDHLVLDLGNAAGSANGASKGEDEGGSASEIQSIMEQFADEAAAPTREEIMSPRHELSSPPLGSPAHFPPRKSSLEPLRSRDMDAIATSPVASSQSLSDQLPLSPPPVPPKHDPEDVGGPPLPSKPSQTSLPHQPPPPEPEPDLPFDFHRFLEQLRHKSADPVAKFLRSFLTEFGKKQWMVHEQVKIISDFLTFITNKMALCEVWREVSENEFDNAKEGMEKLVMNRLYAQTFSPAIPPPASIPRSRSRGRRKDMEKLLGPGRKGQHQEDIERDEVLAQKIRIYSWIREQHLDIPPVGPNGERFLRLAQQELLKIKSYRAPRDKVICVLNCCKVIFGLLKNAKSSDTSADSFIPLLIYVVLQANPENLVSNIQYILRFRNQDKLGGEAGYYLSSLSGAIQFIESLDRTSLTVSDDEFEKNVEIAVSEIAAQNRETEALSPRASFTEKGSVAEPELTPRNSMEVTTASPRRSMQLDRNASSASAAGGGSDDSDAVAGLLRTIQRPLSTIGRIFSDTDTNAGVGPDQSGPGGTYGTPPARSSPLAMGQTASDGTPLPSAAGLPERRPSHPNNIMGPPGSRGRQAASAAAGTGQGGEAPVYDAQEAAARQASAEAAEARKIQRAEHRTVVETLCGMFPNLDKEVIDDVVRQKQGRVGLAVDACLALTAGS
jgi:Rab5 GDP/GTP exchange factor